HKIKQKSPQTKITKATNPPAAKLRNNDRFTCFFADPIKENDAFDLHFEKQFSADCISLSWQKIPQASYYFIYRSHLPDSLYTVVNSASLNGLQSARFNRIRLDNYCHIFTGQEKEKLKSGEIYTYWITAFDDQNELAKSETQSVYFYQRKHGSFTQELQKMSVHFNLPDEYQLISCNHAGASRSLADKSYEQLVSDFVSTGDSLSFSCFYFELKPYKLLVSGNDGYLQIDEVIRAFLPPEYGSDPDYLALTHIMNFDPAAEPVILNSRIMTEAAIKIPITVKMVDSAE
nr:hypothetical protein [Candidatus Cloacimonadota bacterium]